MNGQETNPTEGLDYLQSLDIEPYTKLGDSIREHLGSGIRFVPLLSGECFITKVSGLRIVVLSGHVRLGPDGTELDLENTRNRAVMTTEGENRLCADSDALVLLADAEFLDIISSWEELAACAQEFGGHELEKRLMVVKHTLAFKCLPLEHVMQVLQKMTSRKVKAGEVIIRQGERGDAFYLIWRGHAEVWRSDLYEEEQQLVDTITRGDTFGDEALVACEFRNATIKMIDDGELLVLDEETFREQMSLPLIREVPVNRAQDMMQSGWKVVDVRYAEEVEDGHIPGAIHLPLSQLRHRAEELLKHDTNYIAVCRSGKRSAVAAFLLVQRGFNIVSMKEGMNGWEGVLAIGKPELYS